MTSDERQLAIMVYLAANGGEGRRADVIAACVQFERYGRDGTPEQRQMVADVLAGRSWFRREGDELVGVPIGTFNGAVSA